MTTFRNTEYLVLVDANGDFVSGQVKRVQISDQGAAFPAEPLNFEQADLSGLFDGFNLVVLQENTALKAQVTQLTEANSATTDQMQSQINQLTTTHAAEKTDLQEQLATAKATASANAEAAQLVVSLQAQVAGLESQVTLLTSRVEGLKAIAPFDPRKITVESFLRRLDQTELLMLFSDDDEVVQQIGGMLKDWSKNNWPIVFESPEFQQAMGYLVQMGKLTAERVAAITIDALRQEAPETQV